MQKPLGYQTDVLGVLQATPPDKAGDRITAPAQIMYGALRAVLSAVLGTREHPIFISSAFLSTVRLSHNEIIAQAESKALA